MPPSRVTKPVEDSVPMVNQEIAVGADLEFQKRWWRFENVVWLLFCLLVTLDLIGVFGRGPLAEAVATAKDGSLTVHYERVERFQTPSILRVEFGPSAIHDGKAKLWVSRALIKPLGNQRIIPQPEVSAVDEGGLLYTFQAESGAGAVEFALEPGNFGFYDLDFRVPGSAELKTRIYVVP